MPHNTRPLTAKDVGKFDATPDPVVAALTNAEARSADVQAALFAAEHAARRRGQIAVADTLRAIAASEQTITQAITAALDVITQELHK